MEWNKTNKWTQEEVASFVGKYSDALIRYAFCIVHDATACEEIILACIASFVYRNTDRALSKAYLYRMVHSRCIDYIRFHRRFVPLGDVEEVLSGGYDVEKHAEDRERYAALYRCLNKLLADYRTVLYLQYWEGFSIDEICRVMSKNNKQVYNLLSRAKIALKEELLKEGFENEDL